MEADSGRRSPETLDRHVVADWRGRGLRATWRPDHGFVNLSLWRGDRCVETFHLTPEAASDLIAFLAHVLASSVPTPDRPPLRAVSSEPRLGREPSIRRLPSHVRRRTAEGLDSLRQRVADGLDSVVHQLRR